MIVIKYYIPVENTFTRVRNGIFFFFSGLSLFYDVFTLAKQREDEQEREKERERENFSFGFHQHKFVEITGKSRRVSQHQWVRRHWNFFTGQMWVCYCLRGKNTTFAGAERHVEVWGVHLRWQTGRKMTCWINSFSFAQSKTVGVFLSRHPHFSQPLNWV